MELFSFIVSSVTAMPSTFALAYLAHLPLAQHGIHHGVGSAIVNGIIFSAIWHGIGSLFRGVGGFNAIMLAALLIIIVLVARRR